MYHSPEEGEGSHVDSVYDNEKSAKARAEYLYFTSVEEYEIKS